MSFFNQNRTKGHMKKLALIVTVVLIFSSSVFAQGGTPELKTTTMKIGHLWLGVTANGDKGNFYFQAGFFPNDFGILGNRGQYAEAYTGAGINLSAVHFRNPVNDSLERAAIYSYTISDFPAWSIGKVLNPLTNYLRYPYTNIFVDDSTAGLEDFASVNPDYQAFQNHSYDEIVEVTDSTIFGINVQRKLLAWTQTYNNDYVIADLVFTNASDSTLDSVYINIKESMGNSYFSNDGSYPPIASSDEFDPTMTWQHYYGGRLGDSMRVFYEYSADDPQRPGDDMGAPVLSQNGRLLNPNMAYYAILHASQSPYTNDADDIDDPLQPKVTYIGKETQIPYTQQSDLYGSKNFYAIRGGYSDDYPEDGRINGTHHGINNDELGIADFSNYVAGYYGGISYKYSSFGPYNLKPGEKIHIVYASGFTGIGYEKGKEVGKKWLNGTLEDPPNMPNPTTGWLPAEFKFPAGATEIDKKKDRWISMGIDSVMKSAWRAKWNYEHNYNIPQAPPPPDKIEIAGYGDGVEIKWTDPDAETMPNFAGYRIMRRISNADSAYYSAIYNSDSNDKAMEHVYRDTTAIPSSNTYYYIQSKALIDQNNTNADPATRGKTLYSSRTLVPNVLHETPPRFSQEDLSKIRIVPNPYNINDPTLPKYGYTDNRGITFYNLPPVCTIKIFTENGDLVQELVNNSPERKAGSITWDMLTNSQQVISSGIYIAVFQKPSGELSYQKFIVVR